MQGYEHTFDTAPCRLFLDSFPTTQPLDVLLDDHSQRYYRFWVTSCMTLCMIQAANQQHTLKEMSPKVTENAFLSFSAAKQAPMSTLHKCHHSSAHNFCHAPASLQVSDHMFLHRPWI